MLHDPSHYTPMPVAEEITLSGRDREILRRLAAELAGKKLAPISGTTTKPYSDVPDNPNMRK